MENSIPVSNERPTRRSFQLSENQPKEQSLPVIEAPRQRSQASAKPAPGLYDAVIALWLMAALLFPANYVGRSQDNRMMTYDATGNLLTVTEPDASKADVGYTYDGLKRQLTETSGGLTHQYRYDLAGNRTSVLYGGLSVPLISAYDAQNRLSTLTQGLLVTTYTYDLDGNILTKTLPNGDATTSTFDAANRTMTLVSTRGSGGLPLSSYTYAYDPAANVKQVTEAYADPAMNRVVTNTYDAINRLTQEAVTGSGAGTTLYSYDDAHNRETMTKGGVLTSYSYNSRNQLTSFTEGSSRTVSYTYDNNGNRLTRTEGINTDTLTWDNENRLIALAKTSLGGSGTYGWGYDYRTRRVELAYNATVTKAVFSGGTEVREFENGLPSVDYVRGSDWGGGVGGILYTERAGVPSFTHYNHRGDVTAKTDATGNITYQATYEAFGKRVTETGATLDRQKSNTKDEDVPGYANEGFRFRDLETGAFLSKDPAGFVDGPNLYTYVRQNPWTGFDPDGLWTMTQTAGLLRATGGLLEAGAGISLGIATSWTGVGAVAGGAIALHGFDTAIAGFREVATGSQVDSLTSQGLQAAGMSKNAANLTDTGIGIAGSLGAGTVTGLSKVAAIAATDEAAAGMTTLQILRGTEKGAKALPDEVFKALGAEATTPLAKAAAIESGAVAGTEGLNLVKAVGLAGTGLTPAADIGAGAIGATAQVTASAVAPKPQQPPTPSTSATETAPAPPKVSTEKPKED